MSDEIDRLRLARAEGVGPITYRRLLRRYGSPAEALDALPGLARAGGRGAPLMVPSVGAAEREIEKAARLRARLLFLDRPGYPPLLALLEDAPPVIMVQGRVDALHSRAVALVGSRNASANGQRLAESLAQGLAEAGYVVVSGMARGIDGAAHLGALAAGSTIACVAGGIDMPYPPEHARLQERIAMGGAVVAEARPGTVAGARHFPRRNRVIAGLSLGVVVVEAALRSGSLITARLALECNREVFAVPGSPLDPRCHGSNDLIRQGATLVERAGDVIAHLPDHPGRVGLARDPLFARGAAPAGLPEAAPMWPQDDLAPRVAGAAAVAEAPGRESGHGRPQVGTQDGAQDAVQDRAQDRAGAHRAVLELLSPSPTSVDVLLRRCQLSAATVMSALLDLELAGRVEALPGNRVALLSEPGP